MFALFENASEAMNKNFLTLQQNQAQTSNVLTQIATLVNKDNKEKKHREEVSALETRKKVKRKKNK